MARTSSKRRDTKDRVLDKGEYQKDSGVYEYRYKDIHGKTRSIYSWRLTASDKQPAGKAPCKPLREMIQDINEDKHNNIDTFVAKTTTLNDRFDIYIEGKINLRRSTKQNYIYMYDKYVRGTVGRMKMCDINYSIIQRLYNDMITKYGFKPNSMESLHTVLNPIFDRAVWDNLIDSNPCPMAMKQIRASDAWVKEKKLPLTLEQQQTFMRFLESSPKYRHWLNILTVLLGTGMRIGECLGLTWSECQFKTGMIVVTHTLNYRKQEDGHCRHYVEFLPKTQAGIRSIPMFDEVRTALLEEKERQDRVGTAGTVIDGVSGWVFTNRDGTVFKEKNINDAIERIYKAYNASEQEAAEREGREAFLLPHFTCHQLRKTFCTRLCESENRPKIVQAVMGHANISTTMDVYAEVEERAKKEAIVQLQGTVFIK
ncbi:MAG: site-specific integrase [Oscillospiraceae bacterium]|nr:site-specific integrase [Oscillospiraceae bacterium]